VKVLEQGDITLVTIVPPSGYAEEMKQAAEAAAVAAAAAKAAADAPPAPTGAPGATPVAAAPEKK
jgi:large subunit ribosomal protein L25